MPWNKKEPVIVERAEPIYRALLLECERRRIHLGWTIWKLEEASGLADGHYAKMLHVDRPSGKLASWPSIQLLIETLFPEGFDMVLSPKVGVPLTPQALRMKVRFAAADHDRLTRRDIMRELGKLGGKAKAAKMAEQRKLKVARKAKRDAARKRAKSPVPQAFLAAAE